MKMKIRNIILIACSAVVLLAAVACLAGSIMSHPKKKVKKKIAVRLHIPEYEFENFQLLLHYTNYRLNVIISHLFEIVY